MLIVVMVIKRGILCERSIFQKAKQKGNESLDQFIIRLRKLATYCEQYVFGLPRTKIRLYPFYTSKHKF